jgi:sulfatase maturation enzyme AslB (radical SAM superfamily)
MRTLKFIQHTASLCAQCFRTIPAGLVNDNDQIWMIKTCPRCGEQAALVEPDIAFFYRIAREPRKSVYNHLVLDVSERCNLKCPECYYPVQRGHIDPERTISDIVSEAQCVDIPEVILGGAEPTMRKDLPDLIAALREIGKRVNVITNGMRFADKKYVQELADYGLARDGIVFEAAISLHTPSYNGELAYDHKVAGLRNIIDLGYRIGEIMFNVHDPQQVLEVLHEIDNWKPYTNRFRIRGPHYTWVQPGQGKPIFVSELLNAMYDAAGRGVRDCAQIESGWDNNLYHTMVKVNGTTVRLISCPDERNVILPELLGYGPFYRARNGELTNFIHALLINKGIERGWLHGRKTTTTGGK